MKPNTHPQSAAKVARELDALARHHQTPPPQPAPRFFATITEVLANTLMVSVAGGDPVQVLKPIKVCPAFDQEVDGYTYAYSGDGSQTRTSTAGSSVETQVVVPPFIVDDVVEIGPAPGNIGDYAPSFASLRLQVVNHPAYWSKQESS
jgi:hypothetical protein